MRDFRFPISDLRLRSTIGDSGDNNSRSSNFETSHSHFTSSSEGNIIANGFSSRCFLCRSETTPSSFSASTIKWNPPIPLTATIFPARSAAAVSNTASSCDERIIPSASHNSRCGPHIGHAFGCAWNLRSTGFSYSFRQSGHMVKSLIVVLGRSYGNDSMIENLGPQFVQLVNG